MTTTPEETAVTEQVELEPCPVMTDELRELIIAARLVVFEDFDQMNMNRLDRASEAFAACVPWDDEPSDPEPKGCKHTRNTSEVDRVSMFLHNLKAKINRDTPLDKHDENEIIKYADILINERNIRPAADPAKDVDGLIKEMQTLLGLTQDQIELNASNYDHDDACRLNTEAVEIHDNAKDIIPAAIIALQSTAAQSELIGELEAALDDARAVIEIHVRPERCVHRGKRVVSGRHVRKTAITALAKAKAWREGK